MKCVFSSNQFLEMLNTVVTVCSMVLCHHISHVFFYPFGSYVFHVHQSPRCPCVLCPWITTVSMCSMSANHHGVHVFYVRQSPRFPMCSMSVNHHGVHVIYVRQSPRCPCDLCPWITTVSMCSMSANHHGIHVFYVRQSPRFPMCSMSPNHHGIHMLQKSCWTRRTVVRTTRRTTTWGSPYPPGRRACPYSASRAF